MKSSLLQNDANNKVAEECYISDKTGDCLYRRQKCFLYLYSTELVIVDTKENAMCSVDMNDVIGAKSFQTKSKNILDIYHYPLKTGCCCCKSKSKYRKEKHLQISLQLLHSSVHNWVNAINSLATNQSLVRVEDKMNDFESPRRRKFIVFVNPHSGPGNSLRIWNKYVKHMFEEANIDVSLLITTHAKHACNYICNLENLISFDGVVTVGGDGILAEIVEGIGLRADAVDIFKTVPLIPIPGGTSNGLVKSILFECGLDYSVINMIFVALKGTAAPLDMSLVVTKSRLRYRSFLMLGWGLISDIDILSESLRWMGEPRMYVAAVYFLLRNHHYRGKISMLLSDKQNALVSESDIPALGEPLPLPGQEGGSPGWLVIEDSFALILIVQTTHVSKSMYSGPGVTLNNGEFVIYIVRGVSRIQLASLRLQFDSGEFVSHPRVETYRARAYRLEPLETEKGLFTMDGEVIEYGPIQSVVMPGHALTVKV